MRGINEDKNFIFHIIVVHVDAHDNSRSVHHDNNHRHRNMTPESNDKLA